jgi:hypothetical protein
VCGKKRKVETEREERGNRETEGGNERRGEREPNKQTNKPIT